MIEHGSPLNETAADFKIATPSIFEKKQFKKEGMDAF